MASKPLSSMSTGTLAGLALFPPLLFLGVTAFFRPPLPWHLAGAALSVVWALVFSCMWWNRLDEVAREAQKSAATWGGTFGLMIGLALTVALVIWPDSAAWLANLTAQLAERSKGRVADTSIAFMFGGLFCTIAFAIGFFISWPIWWARKR
jgi:hypothetical protein